MLSTAEFRLNQTENAMTPKTTARSYLVFSLVALFLFYEMGVQVSPSVMTHELMRAMNIGAVGLGIMSGVYFYTYTAMQIPAGLLLDRFGVRYIVLIALIICAVGASLFGFSSSILGGSLARLLMGFGSAFAFVSVLAVAEQWFPARHFALLAGMAQLFAALGAIGGELPMAFSVEQLGWRETMFVLAGISLILAVFIVIFVKAPACKMSQPVHHCDQKILKGLGSIFANKQTWFLAFYAFLNWAPMAAFASLWGVPYLQAQYNFSNSQAAFLVSLMWIGIGLGSPIIGYLSDLIGRRNVLLQSSALIGLAASAAILYAPSLTEVEVGILLFLLGVACSGQVLSFAVVKDNAAHHQRATAIAINNMAVVAAGALLQPLVGLLLNQHASWRGLGLIRLYTRHDYQYALIILPIVFLTAWIVSLFFIRETRCQSMVSDQK